MEGATLGCPLTDRCQQRLSSSKDQVGGASSLVAGKDDDTEIAQLANADTRGACASFWTCHSVRSVGCEMRWVLKVAWVIKHRQEDQVAALKLESPLSVSFSHWQADLWSLLIPQTGPQFPFIHRQDYSGHWHHNHFHLHPKKQQGNLGKPSNKMNIRCFFFLFFIVWRNRAVGVTIEWRKKVYNKDTP